MEREGHWAILRIIYTTIYIHLYQYFRALVIYFIKHQQFATLVLPNNNVISDR